ncbi:hypothetical protein COC42_07280 [Sphingomonas spermidinifaciens]|uniref:HEAT repeat domain-containing protein n=1 Tax=Sphingomonas spermidinifaciens TaxID=1141889 RepID=A0A2A4B7N9_9SPHN|nr:HEAT repeat domain-containing protein [Sphingomonas spermidinifaciens]PCD04097.1 hypothetical protein COC42_07280 [Sphingomonas spermidinifaciens]
MVVSIVFAVTSCTAMAALYVRRLIDERQQRHERADDIALSRELMAARTPEQVDTLRERFRSIDHERRTRVFSHLLQLVRGDDHDRLMRLADALGMPDGAIRRLRKGNAAQRVDAMRELERYPLPRAVEALERCLAQDRRHDVRLEAAAALARIGSVPAPGVLIDTLDLRRRPINRLHEAILRAGAPRHSAELIALSRDPATGRVRPLLVEALGWIGDFSVLAVLHDHAGDPDPAVRAAAARAARKLGHPGAGSWLIPLLLDPFDQVRIQAVRAAGQLGLTQAIPMLAALVENPSWWVRMRAVEALALLRGGQPSPEAPIGLRR